MENHVSLVALAGRDVVNFHPKSDTDLFNFLLKMKRRRPKQIESLYHLSLGYQLDIGHSVRTIDECTEMAAKDITIINPILIESREP